MLFGFVQLNIWNIVAFLCLDWRKYDKVLLLIGFEQHLISCYVLCETMYYWPN